MLHLEKTEAEAMWMCMESPETEPPHSRKMPERERCITRVSDYCMTMAKDPCLLPYLLMPPTETVPLAAVPYALCWGTQVDLCTSPARSQLYMPSKLLAYNRPHVYMHTKQPGTRFLRWFFFAPRSSSNIYTLASSHPHLRDPRNTGTRTQ